MQNHEDAEDFSGTEKFYSLFYIENPFSKVMVEFPTAGRNFS